MDATTMMVIFVVFNMFKRVTDQAKNICDQTVFAVRGIAKLPKVYRILFIDRPGSDLGQLATAIGRKNFPQKAAFTAATPGGGQKTSSELAAFLAERGLEDGDLSSEPLAALEHDFSDFVVIVAINGRVSDHVARMPFHSSALNWQIPEDEDRDQQYRLLRSQIFDLVTLLTGAETTQA